METLKTFDELNISNEVKRAIKEMHLTELFPIQAQTIPKLLAGKDLVGQAQTGTGKTAAFAIPILERVDPNLRDVQAVILVPTRELAVQVSDEIMKMGRYKGAKTLAVYGGASMERQIDSLRRGVQIVVGTPGRMIDHIKRGTLRLNKVKILILDEADRMLDMGFIDDIQFILESVPKDRQTALFSATMPDAILFLAQDYMKTHEVITVSKDDLTVKDTEQVYCDVNYYNKLATLKKIFEVEKIFSAIIFCNTKRGVDSLVHILKTMKYPVEAIHGNLSQSKRNHVMEGFKTGKFELLVATDVAARGLDIKGVSHVINYNMPKDPKDYVHRIGRTGRAGHPGKAITFVSDQEHSVLGSIKWYINTDIKRVDYQVPEEKHVERSEPRSRHPGKPQRQYRGQHHQRPSRERQSRGPDKYATGNY